MCSQEGQPGNVGVFDQNKNPLLGGLTVVLPFLTAANCDKETLSRSVVHIIQTISKCSSS